MESEIIYKGIYKGIPYSIGEIRLFIEQRHQESAPQPWYDYIEFLLRKIGDNDEGALDDIGIAVSKEEDAPSC